MSARPDFLEMAREWLVRARGHSPAPHEASLAAELQKAWELGVANAIEVVHRNAPLSVSDDSLDEVIARIRALTDKPFDPSGN